jgi:hypothetical protein
MSTQKTVIVPASSERLPDSTNGLWINRFAIPSSDGSQAYVISQHKEKRHWGCGCRGWRSYRKCKHLTNLGIPNHEQPAEIMLVGFDSNEETIQCPHCQHHFVHTSAHAAQSATVPEGRVVEKTRRFRKYSEL